MKNLCRGKGEIKKEEKAINVGKGEIKKRRKINLMEWIKREQMLGGMKTFSFEVQNICLLLWWALFD